ncbi:ubiquinone biosynthesis coq9 [Lecanosticta acicola]|uniref:Ubiquinone biosynthesis protein n=1 Tax=Lecanosticta acicola TaxID=111012 RepID=A0AAI8Z3G9_9PEZI|nr:ubiquinone biosynthesis coq9 [Lecanosticta acicola]
MALRTLLRTLPALRPLLIQPASRALYHSYEHVEPPPYRETESAILSSALAHVPVHGFTQQALTLGAKDAGYLDISTNLFPRGAYDLVLYHLVSQRLALKDRIHFSEDIGVGRKVRSLILERLRANVDAGVVGRWQEALGLMSLAENIPPSLKELGLLADEMWFLAGDVSVDASWYTKRASLSGIYATTEVFQTTDQSTDFKDTEEFLDRRMEELRTVAGAMSSTLEWLGFQGGAMVNLLRNKGRTFGEHSYRDMLNNTCCSQPRHIRKDPDQCMAKMAKIGQTKSTAPPPFRFQDLPSELRLSVHRELLVRGDFDSEPRYPAITTVSKAN